ncbi:hypothetical protein ABIB14_002940, partial [Arthrobacter sp. UYEF3]
MVLYISRRIGAGVALVICASFIVFALMLADSDHIARNLLGDQATQAMLEAKLLGVAVFDCGAVGFCDDGPGTKTPRWLFPAGR